MSVLYKVVRRAAILFGLGIIVSNGVSPTTDLRIPGVLQRFAVSYLVVSTLMIIMPTPCKNKDPLSPERHILSDFTDHIVEWIFVLAIMACHVVLTLVLPVPGCPTGYLGPGGIGDEGEYPLCTGGAARYIDVTVFGDSHIYQTPTCQEVYRTVSHDPEGLLGCLTSVALCYLGVQAGRILHYYKDETSNIIIRFLIWGLALGCTAIGLCGATQNGGVLPINKNLWSLSFVLALGAGAFILLGITYLVIDVFKIWNGAPFVYLGMNSITVYFASEVLQNHFPFSFQPDRNADGAIIQTHGTLMMSNLIAVSIFHLIAYYMSTLDFFVKI